MPLGPRNLLYASLGIFLSAYLLLGQFASVNAELHAFLHAHEASEEDSHASCGGHHDHHHPASDTGDHQDHESDPLGTDHQCLVTLLGQGVQLIEATTPSHFLSVLTGESPERGETSPLPSEWTPANPSRAPPVLS